MTKQTAPKQIIDMLLYGTKKEFNPHVAQPNFRYVQMLVTPEQAAYWLSPGINHGNRPLSKGTAAKIVAAMKTDQWPLMPVPICFTVSGRLVDGQHRLTGVVKSGQEQTFIIAFGCKDECYQNFDIGKKRSMSEAMGDGTTDTEVAAINAMAKLLTSSYTNRIYAPTQKAVALGMGELGATMRRLAGKKGSAALRVAFTLAMLQANSPAEVDEMAHQFHLYITDAQDVWPQLYKIRKSVKRKQAAVAKDEHLMAYVYHALVNNRSTKDRLSQIDPGHVANNLREKLGVLAPKLVAQVKAEVGIFNIAADRRTTATEPVVAPAGQEKLL